MATYKLINKGNDMVKFPVSTSCNEQYARENYDFYLTEELGHCYRLHAKDAHFTDDFLPYEIHCPRCYREMKGVGGPRSLHELGLYECNCTKY